MEEKLTKLLKEFRKDCKGEKCGTCKLNQDVMMNHAGSQYYICDIISLIERELGIVD